MYFFENRMTELVTTAGRAVVKNLGASEHDERYFKTLDLDIMLGYCVSNMKSVIELLHNCQWATSRTRSGNSCRHGDLEGIGVIYQLFEIYMPKQNLSVLGWLYRLS